MTKPVEFWFDFVSPMSHIAYYRLPDLRDRTGAEIEFRPMLLGGVMKETGNAPPAMVPAKGAYYRVDIPRCAARYGIPFAPNPHFPVNTIAAMRGCFVALSEGFFDVYADALFRAVWVEAKNVGDPKVFAEVVTAAGLDADAIAKKVRAPDAKDKLIAATGEAVSRGIFGAPSFFVGDELFFGQDRMDYVADALAG